MFNNNPMDPASEMDSMNEVVASQLKEASIIGENDEGGQRSSQGGDDEGHDSGALMGLSASAPQAFQPTGDSLANAQLLHESPMDPSMWGELIRTSAAANSPGGGAGTPSATALLPPFGQSSVANTARSDHARMAALANWAQGTGVAVSSPWASQPSPNVFSYSQVGGGPESGAPSADVSPKEGEVPRGDPGAGQNVPRGGGPLTPRVSEDQAVERLLGQLDLSTFGHGLTDEQKVMMLRHALSSQPAENLPPSVAHPAFNATSAHAVLHMASAPNLRIRTASAGPASARDAASLLQGTASLNSPINTRSPITPGLLRPKMEQTAQKFSPPMLGSNSPAGVSGSAGGLLSPALMNALTAAAAERGIDQGSLMQLFESQQVLDAIAGSGTPRASEMSGTTRKTSHSQGFPTSNSTPTPLSVMDWVQPLSPSTPSLPSAVAVPNAPGVQKFLNSTLLTELSQTKGSLVQLMLSAYSFLNSDSMREFYELLNVVSAMYDEMHELPVVQKRKKCVDMSYVRANLMKNRQFVSLLQAVCALRHHLYSLSRKVLVMNQGPDGIPIDLLLGSMSSELYHVMKGQLPQEVSDFFGNNLPHPKLAVLVFAEFTTVDPMPTMT